MKKWIFVVSMSAAALAGAAYLGGRLWAQQGGGAQSNVPQAHSKIVVMNLSYVFNHYKKWEYYKDELKKMRVKADADMKPLKEQYERLKGTIQTGLPLGQEAEAKQKELRKIERELQEKIEDMNSRLAKEELNCLSIIYGEIEQMVGLYAKARGVEMVLHYNDGQPPQPAGQAPDQMTSSIMNLRRRLTNAACLPMYCHPHLDITHDITNALNQRYQQNQGIRPVSGASR